MTRRKPKRKQMDLRLPQVLIDIVDEISKRSGVKKTDVYNVLITVGMMRYQSAHEPAPVARPARRRR